MYMNCFPLTLITYISQFYNNMYAQYIYKDENIHICGNRNKRETKKLL